MNLNELATKYGSDKGDTAVRGLSPKHYCDIYERLFAHMKLDVINVLEIGVQSGASVKMWRDYFTRATIYGVDIQEKCKQYEEDRIHIFIGDQTSGDFLEELVHNIPPMDIVIDDGAHTSLAHMISFGCLWTHLKPGGFYVIEDVHHTQRVEQTSTSVNRFADSAVNLIAQKEDALNDIGSIEFIRPRSSGALIVIKKRAL